MVTVSMNLSAQHVAGAPASRRLDLIYLSWPPGDAQDAGRCPKIYSDQTRILALCVDEVVTSEYSGTHVLVPL